MGGAAYVAGLLKTAPLAPNALHYAKIIRDKSCLRQLIEKANAIATRCYEEGDVEDVVDFAEKAVFEISDTKIGASYFPLSQIINQSIDQLEERPGQPLPDHRRGHGLFPAGRHDGRVPEFGPHHSGGPAFHGQNRPCPEHRPERGGE